MTRAYRWTGATALALSFAGEAAIAQSADAVVAQTSQSTGEADTDSTIDEIVVTAQKRAENLQRVPIVITAVSGEQLSTAGVTSLQTLPTLAPGLNTRTTAGAFQPSIRGIGTSSNVVENPVALYIDGVYLPQQREGTRELPDVEQIAVLKGPQGTLFGRNATGGVIQITTRRPTQEFELQAHAGIDNYATLRTGVFVSGGLTEGIAASLSADYAKQGEGYGTNRTTGNDTFQLRKSISLRGKVLFEPTSDTEVTVIGDYMDRKDRTYSFVPYPGTSFIVPVAGPLTSRYDTYSPIEPYTAFRGGGVSLTVDHDFGFANFVSITSYREGNTNYLFDDVPVGRPVFYVGIAEGDGPNKNFTQELQLISGGGGPFTYTVGAFYFTNENANLPITRSFFPPFFTPAPILPPLGPRQTQTFGSEKTESIAPFGQIGIELFDETKLTLGARYTYEKRELDGRVELTRNNGSTLTTLFAPDALTIKKPTWRIALDRQFSRDLLGYVSYNRGIKSGGFNILNPANPVYLPERLDAFEAGVKMELLDRRLRLNIGGFYYDYSNLQVTQFVNFAQSIVNGAKARLYGVDVDFNARITPQLTLSGGFELLSAKFTSYPNAVGSIPRPTGGATLISVDASGNRIPQSQEFVGTVAADYEVPASFGQLKFNVTANYNGDYRIEADNFLRQEDYLLLNTSVTLTTNDERYSLTLWGRNLLDEAVLNNVSSQAIGYPVSYGTPPRTYGLTGRVNF